MRSNIKNRIISFTLTMIIIVVGFLAFLNIYTDYKGGKTDYIEKEESFKEVAQHIENIESSLIKMKDLKNSKEILIEAESILEKTEKAGEYIKKIEGLGEKNNIIKFIEKTEGFALKILENSLFNKPLNEVDIKNLELISSTAQIINEVIAEAKADKGAITLEEGLYFIEENNIINENFSALETSLKNPPQIIYDLPFSDVYKAGNARLLSGKSIVTQEEALNKCVSLFRLDKKEIEFIESKEDFTELYIFGGSNIKISVTKKGGYIAEFEYKADITETLLSESECIKRAESLILEMGFKNMKATFTNFKDGVFYTNFYFLDGQTLCYTDLIKVGISAYDGKAVYLNSLGFIINNKERAFPVTAYTQSEAAEKIGNTLNIEKSAVVYLVGDSGSYERCYEFTCKGKKDDEILFVYINVLTLQNEKFLIYKKTEQKT